MSPRASILIASDVAGDAEMVRRLLWDEFPDVNKSVDPEQAVQDFEKHRPNVLILAFNRLDKAELYYLGLYRLGTLAQSLAHRTILLCGKEDLQRVYALCRKQYFDDYVLFWPMGNDAPRLPMAVHHAVRRTDGAGGSGPSVAEFAKMVRKLADLEKQLEQYAARGVEKIDGASRALQNAPEAGAALDGLSRSLTQGELRGIVDVKDQQGLAREIDRLKAVELAVRRKTIESAVEPIRGWASAIKDELQPGLQTIRSLQKLADRVRPLLLLVDDDEFQHKLLRRMLSDVDCDLVSALSGRDAMAALRNCRPDLILMDVQLPDLHGVELTRRIHASDQFARLPILMITGQSDKGVVVESIKAGASGFLVKPIAKDLLLAKIRNSLQGSAADSAA